jgi:hypothetical protein
VSADTVHYFHSNKTRQLDATATFGMFQFQAKFTTQIIQTTKCLRKILDFVQKITAPSEALLFILNSAPASGLTAIEIGSI